MIIVVIYHLSIPPTNIYYNFLIANAHTAISICIFASGIGCYLSYSQDYDQLRFIKRRCLRVLPSYWCHLFFWFIFHFSLQAPVPFLSVLGNIFCEQYFIGVYPMQNWYIHSIWLFYMATPVFTQILDSISSYLTFALFFLFIFFLSLPFQQNLRYSIAFSRLCTYLIGMFVGKLRKLDKTITHSANLFLVASLLFGLILDLILPLSIIDTRKHPEFLWYLPTIIVPAICILLSYLCMFLQRIYPGRFFISLFSLIGQYSLEVYLTHMLLFNICSTLIRSRIVPDTSFYWGVAVFLIFPASVFLHRMGHYTRWYGSQLIGSIRVRVKMAREF